MQKKLKFKNIYQIMLPLLALILSFNSCVNKEEIQEIEEEKSTITSALSAKSSSSVALSYSSITASAQQADNPISHIDDSSMTTRWSGQGTAVNVFVDFGEEVTVDYINIAFFKGDQRSASFSYWQSDTGNSWSWKGSKNSSGTTEDHEEFDLNNITARYFRLKFQGNTLNDWNSVYDLQIFGTPGSTGGTTCIATTPTGRTSDPSSNSADLSWNAISNIDHYNVRYRVAGTSSWTNRNSLQTNSVTLTGLSSGTDYEWQMRAKCADGSASNYSDAESTFTTDSSGGTGGGTGTLDPNQPPSENFDLSKWKITLSSGDEKSVAEINAGYELSNQFYTGSDGGMVFKNYPLGAGTTTNSTYSRVEFREMLRGTNTSISTKGINGNNWVFSSSSSSNQNAAGGVDGVMEATLKVNRVTTTSGSTSQIGRVIIGQIHASDDEPIRLYYHKQPGHSKGAVYFAHDPSVGDEVFENMLGSYVEETGGGAGDYTGASSPSNGIALGEEFSYKIEVVGNTLYVKLYNASGSTLSSKTFDMGSSGFANDYMYFKAGLYSGNKSVSSSSDYEQVTFYNLEVTH